MCKLSLELKLLTIQGRALEKSESKYDLRYEEHGSN